MKSTTTQVPLARLDLPADARRHDPIALKQLTQDMKSQGQLQEIIVVKKFTVHSEQSTVHSKKKTKSRSLTTVHGPLSTVHGPLSTDRYEVIAGVGRTLAAKALKWKDIRASVRENVSDFDKARITFAENEDREDVDAFYQARMIQKMLATKKCTRANLGKELGVSDSLIDAYVAVDGLPEKIRLIPKRLGIGILAQIARLNSTNSKIALATKCASNDWSVRETKTKVERILGSKEGKAARSQLKAVSLIDPLAVDWEKAHAALMSLSTIAWEAEYREMSMPGTQKPTRGWCLRVWPPAADAPDAAEPRVALTRWLSQLAGALDGTFTGDAPAKNYEQQLLESSRKEQSMMKKIGKLIGA